MCAHPAFRHSANALGTVVARQQAKPSLHQTLCNHAICNMSLFWLLYLVLICVFHFIILPVTCLYVVIVTEYTLYFNSLSTKRPPFWHLSIGKFRCERNCISISSEGYFMSLLISGSVRILRTPTPVAGQRHRCTARVLISTTFWRPETKLWGCRRFSHMPAHHLCRAVAFKCHSVDISAPLRLATCARCQFRAAEPCFSRAPNIVSGSCSY